MPKPAETAGQGPNTPDTETRTHSSRLTTKASAHITAHPSTRSQTARPVRPKSPPAAPPSSTQSTSPDKAVFESSAVLVHKKVLNAFSDIADRLDQIIEKCSTVPSMKKALSSLTRHTREAAGYDHDVVISLGNLQTVKGELEEQMIKWCKSIDSKVDILGHTQREIIKATAHLNEKTDGLQTAAKDLETQIGKVTAAPPVPANYTTPYRDALLGGNGGDATDTAEARVLIDMERKAKQLMIVLIDNDTAALHPDELASKANNILGKIEDSDRPENYKVDFINRLSSDGFLFYFANKEAVDWIRQPEIEEVFLKQLAKDAYVKVRPYNVLLRGVPIIFDPSNPSHLCEIEEANGLIKHTIIKARWIKPEARRRTGQTHAHASATISGVETANNLIKNGLDICGARIRAKKLKQKPLQCLRCRRWGHFAARCPEPNDICGTCGENHRTANCQNREKRYCVSCRSDVHASWDRNCPKFIRRRNTFDNNHPENSMVYFPTAENWTLTTRPERIPLEERFPHRFAVNSIPLTKKRKFTNDKRTVPTRRIETTNAQGNKTNTITNYLTRPQDKGKGKAPAQALDDSQLEEEYEECFDTMENNDVETLLSSPFRTRY